MIKLTSNQLRELADKIDEREKFDYMRGVVYVKIEQHLNGKYYLEFEQPCSYAECNSYYYRYDE